LNVKILDSHNRDAFNLIDGSHAVIDNSDIEGSDDAMVIKGDSDLCTKGNNDPNSHILSTGNNATQFGSETFYQRRSAQSARNWFYAE
jgi:hypothetical protein